MTSAPLHKMNPTARFTDRAADYVKYRPSYPVAALDAVVEGTPKGAVAADVGAGTGIFARLLAERCAWVWAIEPNGEMARAAESHDRVEFRSGRAESTGLASACVDIVTCAQAFHWFETGAALAEFHRVLRPRGRLALVWNDRDPADPVASAYRDSIRAVGGTHPSEVRSFDPSVVSAKGLFTPPELRECAHVQSLDEAGFVGRALSASYAPNRGELAEELKHRLRSAHRRLRWSDGLVRMKYVTRVWTAMALPVPP